MAAAPPGKSPKPGLNIYGTRVVNPYKLTIMAEEIGVPYNYIDVDLMTELKTEWYLAINPNGRLPAIVHVKEDGTSTTVFETAACLLYMAHEFDKEHKLSYPFATPEYWEQLAWLSWQVSGYGPMMGQASHFNRYTPEPVPYGAWRYTAEGRRLQHVLDQRLAISPYVAGDRLTLADVAIFVYATAGKWCGIDIGETPHVKAWHDALARRPGFQRALQVPGPYPFADAIIEDPGHQEYLRFVRKYGTQGIKAATNQWKADPLPLPSDHANLE